MYMFALVLWMFLHCVMSGKFSVKSFPASHNRWRISRDPSPSNGIVVIVTANYRLQQVFTAIKACHCRQPAHVAPTFQCRYVDSPCNSSPMQADQRCSNLLAFPLASQLESKRISELERKFLKTWKWSLKFTVATNHTGNNNSVLPCYYLHLPYFPSDQVTPAGFSIAPTNDWGGYASDEWVAIQR